MASADKRFGDLETLMRTCLRALSPASRYFAFILITPRTSEDGEDFQPSRSPAFPFTSLADFLLSLNFELRLFDGSA